MHSKANFNIQKLTCNSLENRIYSNFTFQSHFKLHLTVTQYSKTHLSSTVVIYHDTFKGTLQFPILVNHYTKFILV